MLSRPPQTRGPPLLVPRQVATQFSEAAPVHRVLAKGGIFLRRDGFAFVSSALAALLQDYGAGGFDVKQAVGEQAHVATVTRCLYRDLFAAEGLPQLAATACCSADTAWFDVLTPAAHRARFVRPRCMAAGDACCELRLERTDAEGRPL